MSFFSGDPAYWEQKSTLGKEQQPLYGQMLRAAQQKGAGGAFGESADYYRDLLSNDSQTMEQLSAPELRRFREQTVPDLAEQFAGMGSGALSSSGFRNASVNAGTDLSERLGAIRAQLRQQGAQGLTGIGQQGLQQYNENIYHPATEGLFDSLAPLAGTALGAFAGGSGGAAVGNGIASLFTGGMKKGSTSPYGNQSPGGGSKLPDFNLRMR